MLSMSRVAHPIASGLRTCVVHCHLANCERKLRKSFACRTLLRRFKASRTVQTCTSHAGHMYT